MSSAEGVFFFLSLYLQGFLGAWLLSFTYAKIITVMTLSKARWCFSDQIIRRENVPCPHCRNFNTRGRLTFGYSKSNRHFRITEKLMLMIFSVLAFFLYEIKKVAPIEKMGTGPQAWAEWGRSHPELATILYFLIVLGAPIYVGLVSWLSSSKIRIGTTSQGKTSIEKWKCTQCGFGWADPPQTVSTQQSEIQSTGQNL